MSQTFVLLLFQAPGGSGSFLFSLLPIALMIPLFYFLILGPQRKQQQQKQEMLDALKVGDQVLFGGGMTGVVTQFFDDKRFVQVRISETPAVRVKVLRSAIAERLPEAK